MKVTKARVKIVTKEQYRVKLRPQEHLSPDIPAVHQNVRILAMCTLRKEREEVRRRKKDGHFSPCWLRVGSGISFRKNLAE
jgi:hypothetical protein